MILISRRLKLITLATKTKLPTVSSRYLATVHLNTNNNMPSIVRGTVRYNVPDLSVKPEDRGLFSGAAHKFGEDVDVDLYDPVSTPDIVSGPEGLDVQGFTYVKHQSALSEDDWLVGDNVEQMYVPEVEELVRQVTGAKKVVVNHLGIRKRLSANNNNHTFYRKKGDQHDEAVKKLTEKNSPWGKSMIKSIHE